MGRGTAFEINHQTWRKAADGSTHFVGFHGDNISQVREFCEPEDTTDDDGVVYEDEIYFRHYCYPDRAVLPLRKCWFSPSWSLPCPQSEDFMLAATLTNRIRGHKGAWDCMALPVKEFSTPNALKIIHSRYVNTATTEDHHAFPELSPALIIALVLHLQVAVKRGYHVLWAQLRAGSCVKYIRRWSWATGLSLARARAALADYYYYY